MTARKINKQIPVVQIPVQVGVWGRGMDSVVSKKIEIKIAVVFIEFGRIGDGGDLKARKKFLVFIGPVHDVV